MVVRGLQAFEYGMLLWQSRLCSVKAFKAYFPTDFSFNYGSHVHWNFLVRLQDLHCLQLWDYYDRLVWMKYNKWIFWSILFVMSLHRIARHRKVSWLIVKALHHFHIYSAFLHFVFDLSFLSISCHFLFISIIFLRCATILPQWKKTIAIGPSLSNQ